MTKRLPTAGYFPSQGDASRLPRTGLELDPRISGATHGLGASALAQSPPNLNGACIIDEQGREIPITEAMIEHALETLDVAWETKRAESEAVACARADQPTTA